MKFHKNILRIDPQKETDRIREFIERQICVLRREGVVIGLSGGIDSALCAEICVGSLGNEKVLGLILPERESNPISEKYALKQAKKMKIKTEVVNVSHTLEALETYKKRDDVLRKIFPEYDSQFRAKITLPPDLLSRDSLNFFTLTIDDGKGNTKSKRLDKHMLNAIVAATNTKQRIRMIYLYFYAEKMNYLVCGTTNRTEMLQGFFVKYGDGGVDIEPIAHLYKTQVYQLSDSLGVVNEIRKRVPSPDTYSLEVSDEEFFFRMPYNKLDLLLYAWENAVPIGEVSRHMNLTENQIKRVFRDFNAKYTASKHLRVLPPSLLDTLGEAN